MPGDPTCPHCGGALPAAPPPSRVVRLSDVLVPKVPTVRYSRALGIIEIFGGESAYDESDPYWIERRALTTLDVMLHKLAHLGEKKWGRAPGFLHALADAIVAAVMDDDGPAS
jgi:hypothetical protein